MTVLVTGATGKTGVAVVEALRMRGVDVRAASRHPGTSRPGVEEIRMDWADSSTWQDAMAGVDGIYLVGPYAEADNAELFRRFLAAAGAVQRIVHLSIIGADDLPSAIPMAQWERDVRASGLEWTILRPNWFFQNFEAGFVADLRDRGLLELPAADAPISFVDTFDIAEVAAAALTEPGHNEKTHTITGPDVLSYGDAVAALGRAAGRDLHFADLEPSAFAARLTEAGAPDWAVEWQLALFALIRAGENSPVTDTVEKVTGRRPRSLDTYASRQASHWHAVITEKAGLV